jgi:hypothetical protein
MEVGAHEIWISGWEMECCGEPFAVGSTVSWNVVTPSDVRRFTAVLGYATASAIEAVESHHGLDDREEQGTVEGVVRSIDAVFCRNEERAASETLYPVEGSAVRVSLSSAPRTEAAPQRLDFVGYLVHLDVFAVHAPSA